MPSSSGRRRARAKAATAKSLVPGGNAGVTKAHVTKVKTTKDSATAQGTQGWVSVKQAVAEMKLQAQDGSTLKMFDKLLLFVGNLPLGVSSEAVLAYFSSVEGDKDLQLQFEAGKHRGFGFLKVETEAALLQAEALHNTVFMGRKVRIEKTAGRGSSRQRQLNRQEKRS
jgi:hypothetical protein